MTYPWPWLDPPVLLVDVISDNLRFVIRGRDLMVVGFITTYTISAYHH